MSGLAHSFASDNYAGMHPAVLEAIAAANVGHDVAYGADATTGKLDALFDQMFGHGALGFLAFNGTGANIVALQAITDRWEAVICAESAHINGDEGGAPEKIAGLKLHGIATRDGKLTPELIATQMTKIGFVHHAQPGAVSISQTTEYGTLYTVDEVKAIADYCHANNLMLHMDGARLTNAAAALGSDFRSFTSDAGVDILSLGGTKIGAMGAEAIVTFRPELVERLHFIRKSSMQLASKMRFISAQFLALFDNDLALSNARNANAMAARLDTGLRKLGVVIPNPTQANAVFPIFAPEVTKALQQHTRFYVWDETTGQVRLMCSWDTTEEHVDALLAQVAKLLSE